MIGIITGDIINSRQHQPQEWIDKLTAYLNKIGDSPQIWELYRGDEFQVKVNPKDALETAIYIKALLRSVKGLDVRLGIGVGSEDFSSSRITQCNGTAYIHSGHVFEETKAERTTIKFKTTSPLLDTTLNLLLKLALHFMDHWPVASAEIILYMLDHPNATQTETAEHFKVSQPYISQLLKRSQYYLVLELLRYYRANI